jgi:hypothetical protein
VANPTYIHDHMLTDAEVSGLLKDKNYKLLLKFLKANCGDTFCTEQSGETFEKWLNWCARNSENAADAKDILRRLFAEFYGELPMVARVNLSYLAYEIGYDHSEVAFPKFKYLCKEALASSRVFLASIPTLIRQYVVARRKPSVQVTYFQQRQDSNRLMGLSKRHF